jgi:hypothetical protein
MMIASLTNFLETLPFFSFGKRIMMPQEEVLTTEDLQYIQIGISLALTGDDTLEDMPSTQIALRKLYPKVDRLYYCAKTWDEGNDKEQEEST